MVTKTTISLCWKKISFDKEQINIFKKKTHILTICQNPKINCREFLETKMHWSSHKSLGRCINITLLFDFVHVFERGYIKAMPLTNPFEYKKKYWIIDLQIISTYFFAIISTLSRVSLNSIRTLKKISNI